MHNNNNLKHVGFVALVGRPSTGKSTFINSAVGHNIAISSPLPQSTRKCIRGILTTDTSQIIFTDTPGLYKSSQQLNSYLVQQTRIGIENADIIVYFVDATRDIGNEEFSITQMLSQTEKPIIIVINKIDKKKKFTANYIIFFHKFLTGKPIFKISAINKTGLEDLLIYISSQLPLGEQLYPSDIYTDQDANLRASEIIRKHTLKCLKEEVPHALYVRVEDLEVRGNVLWLRITLMIERESQKPILIGKAGENLRKIRNSSIKELSSTFPYKINLQLYVKVDKNWRSNSQRLAEIFK